MRRSLGKEKKEKVRSIDRRARIANFPAVSLPLPKRNLEGQQRVYQSEYNTQAEPRRKRKKRDTYGTLGVVVVIVVVEVVVVALADIAVATLVLFTEAERREAKFSGSGEGGRGEGEREESDEESLGEHLDLRRLFSLSFGVPETQVNG